MKWISFLVFAFFCTSCKKNDVDKAYSIKGQLFESNSNPIPISNYTLSFYQKANSGLIGGVSGINATVNTNNEGKFEFQYNKGKSYGFSQGGVNLNEISFEGVDAIQYKDLYPQWYPVSSNLDIDLNTIYLYKKIKMLVRKVQFNNSLNLGEKLEVITSNASRADYKTLTGPIPAGTIVIVDTIHNCKLSSFNLFTKQYRLSYALTKPSYLNDSVFILSPGDELFREVFMTY